MLKREDEGLCVAEIRLFMSSKFSVMMEMCTSPQWTSDRIDLPINQIHDGVINRT
jgi:hypothetical protein